MKKKRSKHFYRFALTPFCTICFLSKSLSFSLNCLVDVVMLLLGACCQDLDVSVETKRLYLHLTEAQRNRKQEVKFCEAQGVKSVKTNQSY